MTRTGIDQEIPIETFADWLAHHVYFAPRSAEALTRRGVDTADFARARSYWETAMREDIVADRDELLIAFGKCFAEVRDALRTRKPPIESLGSLPAAEQAPKLEPAPVAAGHLPPSVDVLPRSAANVPAAQPEQAPIRFAAAPPRVALPPLQASFDPDETLPIPVAFVAKPPGAAVPFAGSTSPAAVAEMFDPVEPRVRSDEPDPDETAMLPAAAVVAPKTGTFRDQLGPVVVPLLSLDEYADLRARLTVFGEAHAPTLARYGVAAREVREAVQARFADYFQRNTAAQAQFLAGMQAAIVRARAERDSGQE